MTSTRQRFERMARQFAEQTRKVPGIAEAGIVGSMATETVEPGDLDLAVFLDDREALPAVAKAARRLASLSHRWTVWVFQTADRRFLGWIGKRKSQLLVVDPDFEFEERKFLNVEPRVLWSRADGLLAHWRKECLEKAELVGWPLPKPKADRHLRCMDCGRLYEVSEYAGELGPEAWEEISARPADRA